MLINLSNHPSSSWAESQLIAAKKTYGEIEDLKFPFIAPELDEKGVEALAIEYAEQCIAKLQGDKSSVVHVMGEMTFTYVFVSFMQQHGYECVASTTNRVVKIFPGGFRMKKGFKFVQFRSYPILK